MIERSWCASSAAAGLGEQRRVYRYASSGAEGGDKAAAKPAPAATPGVFCSPKLGGPGFVSDWVTGAIISAGDYSIASQVITQAKAVGLTIVWSAVVAWIAYLIANMVVGLRVPEEEEREGLDVRSHGETAYHT